MPKIKRAIISVYDKSGIAEFARELQQFGVEIISTGGTAQHLKKNGIDITPISTITGFPEILGGRVKTLHPRIYGGLLALRDNAEHLQEIQEHDIGLIDLVVVNLYPFEQVITRSNISLDEALENIDIGGPCLLRAAAKNYLFTTVVTAPGQYEQVLKEMRTNDGDVTVETRKKLACAAFTRTATYDSNIQNFLSGDLPAEADFPDSLTLEFAKIQDLRYGENPHQKAALYRLTGGQPVGLLKAKQLHGKALSYNNFIDTDAALSIVQEFDEPCVAIIKHTNPCGVAIEKSLVKAWHNARATDPVSAFGGIVGLNQRVDADTAKAMSEVFIEVIIAPGFSLEALDILTVKKNIRLLELAEITSGCGQTFELKRVQGGVLVQDQDFQNIHDINLRVVTKRQPTDDELIALKFGWRVCKWVKSNAIVYSKNDRTIGIGAGQMSRIDSSNLAVEKARRFGLDTTGTVLASDAFFPFHDGVDVAAAAGATAIVQPGGSIRDGEVIAAADEFNMAMVFTGVRHFRH